MSCTGWVELLHRQLDGELDGSESVALAEHLGSCEVCRRIREQLVLVDELLFEVGTTSRPSPASPVRLGGLLSGMRSLLTVAALVIVMVLAPWPDPPTTAPVPTPAADLGVVFDRSNSLVVQLATRTPRTHFVWIYSDVPKGR